MVYVNAESHKVTQLNLKYRKYPRPYIVVTKTSVKFWFRQVVGTSFMQYYAYTCNFQGIDF